MHSRFILAFAFAVLAPACGLRGRLHDGAARDLAVFGDRPVHRAAEAAGPDRQPRNRSRYFVRGRGYHRTQRLDEAHRDFRAAFELDPKNEQILAVVVQRRPAPGRSRVPMRRASSRPTQLRPDNPHVLRTVGGDVPELRRPREGAGIPTARP